MSRRTTEKPLTARQRSNMYLYGTKDNPPPDKMHRSDPWTPENIAKCGEPKE
jgi:hypothetical protein